MSLSKANIAGLISPRQQSEMRSILAGTWPPLKPLPVFKYETLECRATIDFDKKCGEWVCRKTSLPSNKVQELRGGLKEVTMALPQGEAEMFTEGPEHQEQELEKDTNRRLQAILDWKMNYESGARYFELRNYLSESQQTEIADSLRLSLTARQLQFNPKNVAYVFDALSTAGGRFATLIELAKRNKAKQGMDPQTKGEGVVPEPGSLVEKDQESNLVAQDQGAAESCPETGEFPAVSIKDVFQEQDQASLPEHLEHTASQPFESEASASVNEDSPPFIENSLQAGRHSEQVRTDPSSANSAEGSSRFPALEISALHVAVFALLFLCAMVAFTVGLTAGRGPLGSLFREAPKSMPAMDAKSPALPAQSGQSTPRTPTPPAISSDDPADASKLGIAAPHEEASKEINRGSESFPGVRFSDSDRSPATESKSSLKSEVNSEHSAAIGPLVRNTSPPVNSRPAPSRKATDSISSAPKSSAPYGPPTIGAAPTLRRPSTILVTLPSRGSQPFRVSFPEKAVAASSSLAMTSQLSVLVPPGPGREQAHRPARLESGELVSFVWPRYPRLGDGYKPAETIRVRATIGQLGQVLGVKFLSGSISLLPASTRAIRQWRFTPTLLDRRPVKAQQDVTIEFRHQQYSSQVLTQPPSHN